MNSPGGNYDSICGAAWGNADRSEQRGKREATLAPAVHILPERFSTDPAEKADESRRIRPRGSDSQHLRSAVCGGDDGRFHGHGQD